MIHKSVTWKAGKFVRSIYQGNNIWQPCGQDETSAANQFTECATSSSQNVSVTCLSHLAVVESRVTRQTTEWPQLESVSIFVRVPISSQVCGNKKQVSLTGSLTFPTVFAAIKPGVFNQTMGQFPAMSVVTKCRFVKKGKLGHLQPC